MSNMPVPEDWACLGISPTDATPEVTRGVLDYEVPGLADAIRAAGAPKVPTAVLSRGLAGVAGRTLVMAARRRELQGQRPMQLA